MKRQIRSHLDLVCPDLHSHVQGKQCGQAQHHNKRAKERNFQVQDAVFARNYAARGPQWLPGHVIAKAGPVSYKVKLSDGRVWHRHIDQIRKCFTDNQVNLPDLKSDVSGEGLVLDGGEGAEQQQIVNNGNQPQVVNEQAETRRSQRRIKPPVRYGYE